MERSEFQSDGTTCVGHWYWPENTAEIPPVVVMGHGLGSESTFGTAPTIDDFVSGGLAVFRFDYRCFGPSHGTPRQWVSVPRQLADWHAALRHVRGDQRVDPKRIAIWGTSMGGGHALSVAARDHELAAVVAQIPHCNVWSAMQNVPHWTTLRTTCHALYDRLLSLFGGVHTIPIVAQPGQVAAMAFPGWETEVLRLRPADSHWVNALPARSMLSILGYCPERTANQIRCPVCIHYGLGDYGVPAQSVERTIDRIDQVESHPFEGGHFAIYHGELRARSAREQLQFLKRVMQFGTTPAG